MRSTMLGSSSTTSARVCLATSDIAAHRLARLDRKVDAETGARMAVVLQPNPVTPDERMGLQLGALTVVREDRAECLHSIPFEPLLAG